MSRSTWTQTNAVTAAVPARLAHVLQLTPLATSATSTFEPPVTLSDHLASLSLVMGSDQALPHLLQSLAAACAEIASLLRFSGVSAVGSSNAFGDKQLNVDVSTHQCVLRHLDASGVCATASSEEEPVKIDLTYSLQPHVGHVMEYSVAFDPLDGSSIIDANFAVGSIFSVFPGRELLNRRIDEQAAAAIALYGPRTSIIFALPGAAVFEAMLSADDQWLVTRPSLSLSADCKTFAPANLRATAEDEQYRRLVVDHYLARKYTLRYSGGLVPDFYHALIKGQGVFLSPVTHKSPAKLRLLYEAAALSFISARAGGGAVDQHGRDLLTRRIGHYDERTGLIIGSRNEVERYCQAQPQQKAQGGSGAATGGAAAADKIAKERPLDTSLAKAPVC